MHTYVYVYVWLNYNSSPTWKQVKMIPLTNHHSSEVATWGHDKFIQRSYICYGIGMDKTQEKLHFLNIYNDSTFNVLCNISWIHLMDYKYILKKI